MDSSRRQNWGTQMRWSSRPSMLSATSSRVEPMDCTRVPEEEDMADSTLHPWCRHVEKILHHSHEELFARLDSWMADALAPGRVTWSSEDPRTMPSQRPSTSSTNRGGCSPKEADRRPSRFETTSTEDPLARLMMAERSTPIFSNSKKLVLDDDEHEKVALETSKLRREWNARQGSKVSEHSLDEQKSFLGKTFKALQEAVESRRFEAIFSAAMLSNALFIGISLQVASDRYGGMVVGSTTAALEDGPLETVIHGIYACIFLIELLIRLAAYGKSFFCSSDRVALLWNYMDALLVTVSMVETILVVALVEDSELGMSNKLRTMRVIRLFRLIRMLRAVRFFRGLRTLIYSIFYTLKALAWSLILLLGMIYVMGILLTDATMAHVVIYEFPTLIPEDSNDAVLYHHFGSLHLSMHTLFRSITGGVDWSILADALASLNWFWVYLFSAYIAFCLFAVLNVMTGVFCQRATELAERDHEAQLMGLQIERERLIDECRNLFRSFDMAKQGTLTLLEFEMMLQRDDIKASFRGLDIEVSDEDAWRFFRLLDVDGNGVITEEEFVQGALHLRGPARTIDVVSEAEESRRMKAKLTQMEAQDRRVEVMLRTLSGQITQLAQLEAPGPGEGRSNAGGTEASVSLQVIYTQGFEAGFAAARRVSGERCSSGGYAGRGNDEAVRSHQVSSGSGGGEEVSEGRAPGTFDQTNVDQNRQEPDPSPPPPPPPPTSPCLRRSGGAASPRGVPVFLFHADDETARAASDRVQRQIEKERVLKWDFDLHFEMDPRGSGSRPGSPSRQEMRQDRAGDRQHVYLS